MTRLTFPHTIDSTILSTYRAVMPFVASDFIRTAILVTFPGIVLFALRF